MLCPPIVVFFFFNDTATTEIYTLSLHDALPILSIRSCRTSSTWRSATSNALYALGDTRLGSSCRSRSEEHTSELQSRLHLVCRLLLEKKTRSEASVHDGHRHTTRHPECLR